MDIRIRLRTPFERAEIKSIQEQICERKHQERKDLCDRADAKLKEDPGYWRAGRVKRAILQFTMFDWMTIQQEKTLRWFLGDPEPQEVNISFRVPLALAQELAGRQDFIRHDGGQRASNYLPSENEKAFGAGFSGFAKRALYVYLEQNPVLGKLLSERQQEPLS